MDTIDSAAAAAKYIRLRYNRISGEVLVHNAGQGRIMIQCDLSLQDASQEDQKKNEFRGKLSLKTSVFGIPEGVPRGPSEADSAAFRADVDMECLVCWPRPLEAEIKENDDLSVLLARPLYMAATGEIKSIFSKFGVSGINLVPDLKRVVAAGEMVPIPEDVRPKAAAKHSQEDLADVGATLDGPVAKRSTRTRRRGSE